jgi:hypothetical protein
MHFNKHYVYTLILVSLFLLTGASRFSCSWGDDDNKDKDSSGGDTDVKVNVSNQQKISAGSGGFNGNLEDGDQFGSAIADPGDLEADGVVDLAVGSPFYDGDGSDEGAVWILFMDDDGRVDQQQKISSTAGGFEGNLKNDDQFGSAVTGVGDLNSDGAFDLAVGMPGNDNGGTDRGGVWVLFLDAEGKVREEQKIADDTGGFGGTLHDDDRFGSAVADIGDVNGDGIPDLAVGAPNTDDGSENAGAVWILFMRMGGNVNTWQKISTKAGGFDGNLDADAHFGAALAGIGDLDSNGVPDLAVGVPGNNNGGPGRGGVWILFLDAEGKVMQEQKIADESGGFGGGLGDDDHFGSAIAGIGDVNDDGVPDLAVGAPNDDDGSDNAGAVWILMMKTDGKVEAWQKVSSSAGGFDGNLNADDYFGAALAGTGDLDSNGTPDMAVGAPGYDNGGTDLGAVWILFMEQRN